MRRSKSNPAKYARNYRKISQRHMTGYNDDGDGGGGATAPGSKGSSGEKDQLKLLDAEKRRLESILHRSERTWKRGLTENGHDVPKNRKAKTKKEEENDNDDNTDDKEGDDNDNDNENDDMLSLLSPELREQFSGMGNDTLLILPSNKKKNKTNNHKSKAKQLPPLTPAEIKAAKSLYKNTQRKLAQLEKRRKQKEVRGELYRQLEEHTLLQKPAAPPDEEDDANADKASATTTPKGNSAGRSTKDPPTTTTTTAAQAQSLLLKSSELGKRVTKKQRLKQLRKREALGIPLTKEETDLLYDRYEAPSAESFAEMMVVKKDDGGNGNENAEKKEVVDDNNDDDNDDNNDDKKKKKKRKKKKDKKRSKESEDGKDDAQDPTEDAQSTKKARTEEPDSIPDETSASKTQPPEKMDTATTPNASNTDATSNPKPQQPSLSFAQRMFANLTSLKRTTDTNNENYADERAKKRREEEERIRTLEEEERKKRRVYVPTEIDPISTVHRMLDDDDDDDDDAANDDTPKSNNVVANATTTKVQAVHRPPEIEALRYDLPVSAMEYEIVDAVRNHDCTVLCGETGSGKSTQVPQFLYEAGFAACGGGGGGVGAGNNSGSGSGRGGSDHLLIGITQPRRVAAVSTAKRVAYEMGHGNGSTIPPNNLVAYQTRYETAGLGNNTRLKFMTDGILLQEIQSDLLLRKYGAVIIDEAHERNLNTDVLLGLLSVALPLRRKAAEESEGRMPPLKLIVMSATLRVEDFTENARWFPPPKEDGGSGMMRPALVKVPGRTHPVSIHHSKVTELDDYEKVAMEKACKIHRKLPSGGILVFLTGKQEIVRCVNRLKQRLERTGRGGNDGRSVSNETLEGKDVSNDNITDATLDNNGHFRDMDDEEADGDLFQRMDGENDDDDDFDNLENGEDVMESESTAAANGDGDDEKRPKKVRILPLYSMLSADEQAKVFAPVPEDTRLIVVATNIAETSITIPGISYVVDSGRQKCRNYHATTGVASYDIMWISKAAADQRAGRAGRTGPGHCYRLYSSSVYSRYLDEFALPEVLTRPLEDVVLAMKAMNVTNVTKFPFPTPPDQGQVTAAVRLLANLGCVDVSLVEELGGDGKITPLGAAVAKLPLGVRYGKMLLVAAQANVLDYAIALVAVLSESSPFVHHREKIEESELQDQGELKGLDEVDRNQTIQNEKDRKRDEKMKSKWQHDGGDILSAVKAVGAYAYAGRGAGGNSEKLACRKFCEENGLNLVVMQRIAKMRGHLCKLAKTRLPHAEGVAATSGKYLPSMPPPKRIQECLLRQAIASGLLDNIARRAPPGVLPAEFSGVPRSAYICANSRLKEPLFIDNNSTVHSQRPEWVCFDSIVRKTKKKDGSTVATMQRVTPIDPEWLATLCHGSNLMKLGACPLNTPLPRYAKEKDSIQCAVETKFGGHGWEIPPCYVDMYETIQKDGADKTKKLQSSAVMQDDSFRWFARYLLEGKVLPEMAGLLDMLNDDPAIITRRKPAKKVMLLVSALSDAGVDSAAALRKHWAEKNDKFLFKALKPWVTRDSADDAKSLWITAVKSNVDEWKNQVKMTI